MWLVVGYIVGFVFTGALQGAILGNDLQAKHVLGIALLNLIWPLTLLAIVAIFFIGFGCGIGKKIERKSNGK